MGRKASHLKDSVKFQIFRHLSECRQKFAGKTMDDVVADVKQWLGFEVSHQNIKHILQDGSLDLKLRTRRGPQKGPGGEDRVVVLAYAFAEALDRLEECLDEDLLSGPLRERMLQVKRRQPADNLGDIDKPEGE